MLLTYKYNFGKNRQIHVTRHTCTCVLYIKPKVEQNDKMNVQINLGEDNLQKYFLSVSAKCWLILDVWHYKYARLRCHIYFNLFSQKVQLKQKVADAFLDRFQLKPHEVEALKNSRNEPITEVKYAEVVRKVFISIDLFNNYSPKARWILVSKNRDEVEIFIHQYSSSLRWIIVLV